MARGVGIAVGEWRSGSGPSTASISVNEDGTVGLLTGSVDISGSDTSLAQIAAEVLGLELEQVIVAKRDTDLAPFTGPSGGSRIVYSQGKAVEMAAGDARDKLLGLAADRLGVQADALECEGGAVYVMEQPAAVHRAGAVGADEPVVAGRPHSRHGVAVQYALQSGVQRPGCGGAG